MLRLATASRPPRSFASQHPGPVFFVQDATKFPDLIHGAKLEANSGYPQAATAHDTFWDFVSLMPESTHMLTWAMSDRTIPRSLRMIEGGFNPPRGQKAPARFSQSLVASLGVLAVRPRGR